MQIINLNPAGAFLTLIPLFQNQRAYIQYQVNGLPVGASSAVRKTHSEEAQADTDDALSFKDDYTNSNYQDHCLGRSARVMFLLQVPLLQMLLPHRFH